MDFAVVQKTTPILNHPCFQETFGGSAGDALLLEKRLETIAFEGTQLFILERVEKNIFAVAVEDYPSTSTLYIDGRFLRRVEKRPCRRETSTPPFSLVLERLSMIQRKALPYIWGGNWSQGIPEMLFYYPPRKAIDDAARSLWTLRGNDCSGLLYEATNGHTPRNTSQLIHYGEGVPIEGLNPEALIQQIMPLDLIVWAGHVIIAFTQGTTIESREHRGVVVTPLRERLQELLEKDGRSPLNQPLSSTSTPYFLIRRWHPESIAQML
jgi:hypothetical protein